MRMIGTASLWLAGVLAILGALGIARLDFMLLFFHVDALMLAVGVICLANAYWGGRRKRIFAT